MLMFQAYSHEDTSLDHFDGIEIVTTSNDLVI